MTEYTDDEKRLAASVWMHRALSAEARVSKLEAALEEIADGMGCDSKYGPGCDTHCKTIARRAMVLPSEGEKP